MIELIDIKKTYTMGTTIVEALRGITFTIKDNEFVAITGPSGSGKTTILNLIATLDRPTGGDIKIDGTSILSFSDKEATEFRLKKIGIIFQEFFLIPTLTAYENIELPMKEARISKKSRIDRVTELLKLVKLEHRSNHFPHQLSGGEQQRVAIARALANHPAIILADEPTGELDRNTGLEIIELLRKLNLEQKVTVVLVTHDREIAQLTDRIINIKDGKIETIQSSSSSKDTPQEGHSVSSMPTSA